MRKTLIAACATTALLAAGCGAGSESDADELQVVSAFYPSTFLIEKIGGDEVSVTSLTAPGADSHGLELTPKQVASVHDADVVTYLADFQSSVDAAIESADRRPETTIDIGHDIDRELDGEAAEHEDGEEAHEHDHEHSEETHEHEHSESEHDGHDHGPGDPHIWLNPANMVSAAEATRDALIEARPEAKADFTARADELIGELEKLDTDFSDGLQKCERRDIVVSHAAFGHLADAYDLVQHAVAGIEPDVEPTSGQIAKITALVDELKVTTVFTEPLNDSSIAETIAHEAGVQTAALDPIEGLSSDGDNEDYISLMRKNLDALRTANGCQ